MVTTLAVSVVLWVFLKIAGLDAQPKVVTPVDEAYADLQPVYSFFDFLGSGAQFVARVAFLASVTFPVVWLASSILFWRRSTTPAKKMMRLRVVDASSGEPAGMVQMMVRELVGKLVNPLVGVIVLDLYLGSPAILVYLGYFTLGAFLVVAGPGRQAIWDHLARTRVVRAN